MEEFEQIKYSNGKAVESIDDFIKASDNETVTFEEKLKSESKANEKKYVIIRYTLLALLCALLVSLIIAVGIILAQISYESSVRNKLLCSSICGCGGCYYVNENTFDPSENKYEGIIQHLKALKDIGIGTIILEDILELILPENEDALKTLISESKKYEIQVFYSFSDIGSVPTDHPWSVNSDWFHATHIENRKVINFAKNSARSAVVEVLSKYLSLGISGIHTRELPRLEVQDNLKTVDIDSIPKLKSEVKKLSSLDLYILIDLDENSNYTNQWSSSDIDGIINKNLNKYNIEENYLEDFINEEVNNQENTVKTEKIWTFGIRGFEELTETTVLYTSNIIFSGFLPKSVLLFPGDEFRLYSEERYSSKLLAARNNEESIHISQTIKELSLLKQEEVSKFGEIVEINERKLENIIIFHRINLENSSKSPLIFVWNRNRETARFEDIFEGKKFSDINILVGNNNVDNSNGMLLPGGAVIVVL